MKKLLRRLGWEVLIADLVVLGVAIYAFVPPYIFIPATILGIVLGDLLWLKILQPILRKGDGLINRLFNGKK